MGIAQGRAAGYHSGIRAGIMVAMIPRRGWKGVERYDDL